MRTREELKNPYDLGAKSGIGERWDHHFEQKVLELLLDIRELLEKK